MESTSLWGKIWDKVILFDIRQCAGCLRLAAVAFLQGRSNQGLFSWFSKSRHRDGGKVHQLCHGSAFFGPWPSGLYR